MTNQRIIRQIEFLFFATALLAGVQNAQAYDWPVQGPCDDQCMEPYVAMDLHMQAGYRRALNAGTTVNLSGLACYDAFPRDGFCDMPYEGVWTSGWAQRPAEIVHTNVPVGSTNATLETIQSNFTPNAVGGATYVTWSMTAPIQSGFNRYFGFGVRSHVERVQVDELNGYTMPTVPVHFDWSFSTDAAIDAMNHLPSGETGGLPEGFSFAELVRAQSMVWTIMLTNGTGITVCNDAWGEPHTCPVPSQQIRIEFGREEGPLGTTAYDGLSFPFAPVDINSAVPSVLLRGIESFVEANFCSQSFPSQCRGDHLYATDDTIWRVDDVAYMIGSTAAHEVGHAVGLVPDQLFGTSEGHVPSDVPTYEADVLELIMAPRASGFGVVREEDGTRVHYRQAAGWSWANWEYLVFGR